jgi:hypothetical protein
VQQQHPDSEEDDRSAVSVEEEVLQEQHQRRSSSSSRTSSHRRGSTSRSTSKPTRSTKKHHKHQQLSEDPSGSDSDNETEGSKLPPSFLANKENQRLEINGNMSKTSRQKEVIALKDDIQEKEAKIVALEAKVLQQQAHAAVKKSGRKVKRSEWTEEEKRWYNTIHKAVKMYFWNAAKFVNSEAKLDNGARAVLYGLNLKEFEGLEGKPLKKKIAMWVAEHRDYVRMAINET